MSDDTRKKIAESRWLDWLDKRFRLKQYIIDSMELTFYQLRGIRENPPS